MLLRVLTPAETLLEVEEAEWVHVRLVDGTGLSIYPGHAALLAETVTADVQYADVSGEHALVVEGGILQVENHDVTVFTSGSPESDEGPAFSTVEEAKRFERLAQELKDRLADEAEDLLEGRVEKG